MATQTQGVVRKSLDPLPGSDLTHPCSLAHAFHIGARLCPHVLRHASVTRSASRRVASYCAAEGAEKSGEQATRRKEKKGGEETAGREEIEVVI